MEESPWYTAAAVDAAIQSVMWWLGEIISSACSSLVFEGDGSWQM